MLTLFANPFCAQEHEGQPIWWGLQEYLDMEPHKLHRRELMKWEAMFLCTFSQMGGFGRCISKRLASHLGRVILLCFVEGPP